MRYYAPGGGSDPIEDLCPCCGCPFEPAGELSELIGFRAVTARDAPGAQQGLVARLGALLDAPAARAQAHRDRRSHDDGDDAIAEAVALRRPDTTR